MTFRGMGIGIAMSLCMAMLAAADEVTHTWHGYTRTWVGPDFWANRLQDWQVANGRVECIEGSDRFGDRMLHSLTHRLRDADGEATIEAVIGPIDPPDGGVPAGYAGFLIGAGGSHVDARLTALVHGRPAPDGGMLIVVDRGARIRFFDYSVNKGRPVEWDPDGAKSHGPALTKLAHKDVRLSAAITQGATGVSITTTLTDAVSGEVVTERTIDGLDAEYADGAVALVSSGNPRGADGGFYFTEWTMRGEKIVATPELAFGPVMAVQHTLHNDVLKLTAQMAPLGSDDSPTADLQVRRDDNSDWETVATADLTPLSYTAPFRVEGWDGATAAAFRVVYDYAGYDGKAVTAEYAGAIPADPVGKDTFVLAAFTGHKCFTGEWFWNHTGVWFPHRDIADGVAYHKPDLLFFSGDQIYESDMTPPDRRNLEKSSLDYLYKWYRWCWAFGDLTRDVPCIAIPDDHDVYHGNIWGAGGRHAEEQDDGGYRMPAEFVNAVQRTQTSHLPDPYDPTPVEQGITVYYTDMLYGGIDFAVIEDRKWKSSPTVAAPDCDFVNGWPQNPDCDPAEDADVPGAVLLGDRQLKFLNDWATDTTGDAAFKAVLSQTIFANVATLPGGATGDQVLPRTPFDPPDVYPEGWKLATDADSNGWPQTGRNEALRAIRKGNAVHIAGDQHLGSVIQYGVDAFGDAGYAFCVPSIANTWPRRWLPPEPGANPLPHSPRNTGDFLDGFGNPMTVFAVSNPALTGIEPTALHNRAPGYGIVRFDKPDESVTFECWPRSSNPREPGAQQYDGWPITVKPFEDE